MNYRRRINELIGKELKRRRKLKGYSQEELGQLVDARSNVTVSYWEKGKVAIPNYLIAKLYKILRRNGERCISLTPSDVQRIMSYRQTYNGQDVVLMDEALARLYVKPLTEFCGTAIILIEDAVLRIPSDRWYEFKATNDGKTQCEIYKGTVLEEGWSFEDYSARGGIFSKEYLSLCYEELADEWDNLISQAQFHLRRKCIHETETDEIIDAIYSSDDKYLQEIGNDLSRMHEIFNLCYFEFMDKVNP